MIRCCIDNFSINNEEYILGGWGYKLIDGKRYPIEEYSINTEVKYQIKFDSRQDFSNEQIAFYIKTKSASLFYSIIFDEVEVLSFYGDESIKVTIWEKVIEKLIVNSVSKIKDNKSLSDVATRVVSLLPKNYNDNSVVERSIFEIDVGFESYCKDVIVGKDGFLFLTNGSNHLQKYYQQQPNNSIVVPWKELIAKRAEKCYALNARMLQIIFPEKQSVLYDKYPVTIHSETSNLKKINEDFNTFENYVNITKILRDAYVKHDLISFRKLDSHLTYQGAKIAVIGILNAMGIVLTELNNEKPLLQSEIIAGDLGNRFGFGNFREHHLVPDLSIWEFALRAPKVLESFIPESGHTNSYYHWLNESAPIKKKVMIFGNSMFERGTAPTGLSFWFSRLFSEVIFIWSANMSINRIEEYKPDFVICQTVERFLPTLPRE